MTMPETENDSKTTDRYTQHAPNHEHSTKILANLDHQYRAVENVIEGMINRGEAYDNLAPLKEICNSLHESKRLTKLMVGDYEALAGKVETMTKRAEFAELNERMWQDQCTRVYNENFESRKQDAAAIHALITERAVLGSQLEELKAELREADA